MKNTLVLFAAVALFRLAFAQAVLPGYLTDPSMMKGALAKDASYQTPEQFKYPYIATYYVKPTVPPSLPRSGSSTIHIASPRFSNIASRAASRRR